MRREVERDNESPAQASLFACALDLEVELERQALEQELALELEWGTEDSERRELLERRLVELDDRAMGRAA